MDSFIKSSTGCRRYTLDLSSRLDNFKGVHQMAGDTQPKVVKVPCAECGGNDRNHSVLREFVNEWDDEYGVSGSDTYQKRLIWA